MTARLIDGRAVAEKVRNQVAAEVAELERTSSIRPGLATVLVGDDPASHTYVRMKHRACQEAGIASIGRDLPGGSTQEQVEAVVRELAADPQVHGILVQLPLPRHLDEEAVLCCVPVDQDVDGFHPVNLGRLAMKGREPRFVPCTPDGCMVLLEECGVSFAGARAVVVGRSNIVGMPAALLLVRRDATVTVVHSRTRDMGEITRQADILVVAIGKPRFVTGDMIRPGAAVIDVGVNRVDDPGAEKGYRLVGDVEFDSAGEVAGWLTPVPGGVGPMTIAMLLRNTVRAARLQLGGTVALKAR
ncbi:MAG: bifunctional methylenetetrahydrofolate dehydrogenase/methenyltetrahydrofolate cyclohydrolase FolD [Armatimonadetes bacterium]|nr:bifunctional methylenetetrahydrofolate dehydrogenase/methenyltetrahydrofolate cyclohydrolase FolD [Armatimonadota bacterium]